VHEVFESGPNRFDGVVDVAELQFPVKAPAPDALQASLDDVRHAAAQARLIGFAGIAVGALGLLTAVVALARQRSRQRSQGAVHSEPVR
ncbi:MAG: hypothetical protein M3281_05150, partial [Chloroflexota bacterium]|nr:hypothetical protein [Chloroflexota bacterium]